MPCVQVYAPIRIPKCDSYIYMYIQDTCAIQYLALRHSAMMSTGLGLLAKFHLPSRIPDDFLTR